MSAGRRLLICAVAIAGPLLDVVLFSSACIAAFTPRPGPVAVGPVDASLTRRVYAFAWGHHSSIFVEQPPGWRLGPEGDEAAPFVEYGWGDRRFYFESNFAVHSLFASALLPTESVVYVCGHALPPNEEVIGADVYVRECGADELARLVTVLEGAMVRGANGARPRALPPTPEYPGRFYPGREYYVVWWNCNEWTVRMLRDGGFDASPALVFSKDQVGGSIHGFRRLARKES